MKIRRADESDSATIAHIGYISVGDAHRASCSAEDMGHYLSRNYNEDEVWRELSDTGNIYHIIYYGEQAVGFSKIVLNAEHPGIAQKNTTKLDRIYLLQEFHDKKLGFELLQFNIELSKQSGQSGMWLFTWTENHRAVNFYKKVGFAIVGSHMFKVSDTHSNPNHHMFLAYHDMHV
jgi:ribosomal protein S18 acetylase RimI-like enzyme